VFAAATITATALLWHTGMALWLELLICITLLGLIVGNILKGTNLMRVSFIANRVFNIFNHIYFANLIAIIIAVLAIVSNIVYYIRALVAWIKKRKQKREGKECCEEKTEGEVCPFC
jgi:predicted membrane protein